MTTWQIIATTISKHVLRWHALPVILLLFFAGLASFSPAHKAAAQSEVVQASQAGQKNEIEDRSVALKAGEPQWIDAEQVGSYLDPSRSLTITDMQQRGDDLFVPLPAGRIDLGYTPSQIWLRIPVHNASDVAIEPVMVLHARFMHHLEAYRTDADTGLPVPILQNSNRETFDERQIAYRHLAAKVPLEPGERTVIYIGYWSDGASEMPISFETPVSFEQLSSRADIFNFTIYAACFAMIAFTLMATAAMRWRVHVAYALYFGWVVLFLAHMEGYTFQYLWPDWPGFNAYGSLSIGYGLSFFAILFTREFLKLRNHAPFLDRLGLIIMIGTVLVIVLGSFGDTLFIKRFGFVFNLGTTIFLIASAIVSIRNSQPGAVYYLIGWSAIFLATFLSAIAHWIEDIFALSMTNDFIAIAVLFEAVIFTLAINSQIRVLRAEKEQALTARLGALEENLQLERDRADALAQAEARRNQLAKVSHDAKQPLLALRLALEGETGRGTAGKKLHEILSYLDSLIARQLSETTPGSSVPADADSADRICDAEAMVARLDAMFRSEAEAKGLRFMARARSGIGECDPMPVLRILSNLLANAIKHTPTGRVGIRAYRTGELLQFAIFDTGPGMDEAQLEAAKQAYVKGPDSGGHGLGLMIAFEIANAYGLDLNARQRRRGGLCFTLTFPILKSSGSAPTKAPEPVYG